jgi:hypothetical protein
MATIDPMASLKATAEQRTRDFEGLPLEPETPNREPIRFSREDRTFYIHPSASIHTARSLWDDAYPESPLYDEDDPAERVRVANLSEEEPWASVAVYRAANVATGDGEALYWGEVTGSVTDTFLGIVTDPDVLLRRAAELDLEHIS